MSVLMTEIVEEAVDTAQAVVAQLKWRFLDNNWPNYIIYKPERAATIFAWSNSGCSGSAIKF
jgi:hypothetical protein